MPAQLSFDHQFNYSDNDDGIKLPTILTFGDKVIWTDAIVDTEAMYCVFACCY